MQRKPKLLVDLIDGEELSSFIDELNQKSDEHFDNYLIAYIDFLGMTKQIQSGKSVDSLLIIKKILSTTKKQAGLISDINLLNEFKIKVFSDNIVIAIKIDKSILKAQISSMINLISLLQFQALFPFEYALRGGITIGELYIDESVVWGTGLIDAYNIENSIANYPRVIVDRKVLTEYDNSNTSGLNVYALLKEDFDGFWYVNFYTAVPELELIPNISMSLKDMIRFNTYDSDKTKQKINWIINSFNNHCREFKDRGDYEKYIIPYI